MMRIKNIVLIIFVLVSNLLLNAQTIEFVKDINEFGSSNPQNFFGFNDKLYFSADDGVHGFELWVSDGSDVGTYLLKDINVSGSSMPEKFIEFNNKLFFIAYDTLAGNEIWMTDGTILGTELLIDASPFVDLFSHKPFSLKVFNGHLYFFSHDSISTKLWMTDGTSSGTIVIDELTGQFSSNSDLIEFDNMLFFDFSDTINGTELWVSNGTYNNASVFKDLYIGTSSSSPKNFNVSNGLMFFSGVDSVGKREPWVTDGSITGTKMVKNINLLHNSLYFQTRFYNYNNKVYFIANDETSDYEIWTSDGTELGTQILKDISLASGFCSSNSFGGGFQVLNDKLIFYAKDCVVGKELWITDGTHNGTFVLKNIKNGYASSDPRYLVSFNDYIVFNADDGSNGHEIWITDGTTNGTYKPTLDFVPKYDPIQNYGAYEFRAVGDILYFGANYDSTETELWKMIIEEEDTTTTISSIANSLNDNLNVVYPNPSTGTISFDIESEIISSVLYNQDGKVVKQHEKEKQINIEDISNGIYFIKIKTIKESFVVKIVKI